MVERFVNEIKKNNPSYNHGEEYMVTTVNRMKYVIMDCFKKENSGIHAEYDKEEEALKELSRDDIQSDGFYMITYAEETVYETMLQNNER